MMQWNELPDGMPGNYYGLGRADLAVADRRETRENHWSKPHSVILLPFRYREFRFPFLTLLYTHTS